MTPRLVDFGITEESLAEADAYFARLRKREQWISRGLALILGILLVSYLFHIGIRDGAASALVVGLSCAIFFFVPWLYVGLLIRLLFDFYLDCFSRSYLRASEIRRRYEEFEKEREKYEANLDRGRRDS